MEGLPMLQVVDVRAEMVFGGRVERRSETAV